MPEKLGQNFLHNLEIAEKIVDLARIESDDFVLEIGPGKGILTERLVKKVKQVVAVEIDGKLVQHLKDRFKDAGNLEIVNDDILNINLENILPHTNLQSTFSLRERGLGGKGYKVIANIPYYITSKIIRKFLENSNQPQEMILMVQKEVAERIVAHPGKMSLLSVSVKYYARPKILLEVDRNNFTPVPEVDSAVISIKPERKFSQEKDMKFFRLVKIGFSAKRKTLLNNLSNGFQVSKDDVLGTLKELGFSKNTRAQELSVEDWMKLNDKL